MTPAVSQHLKVLRDARLVRVTQQGTRRLHAIDPAGLLALRAWVDAFWDEALGPTSRRLRRRHRRGAHHE